MTEPEWAIEVTGLNHAFGRQRVLHDVDLRVSPGSIHGFVGPNGAGKTTTLNVLATLLTPKRGKVSVLGIDARREPKRIRRKVGYMPEHFAMYRQLTVFEYLDFFAAAHGQKMELRDRRLAQVVETADIGSFVHRGIGTLSRGMQQRVCLARVMLHEPQVLLLDEPASGLDPRARAKLLDVVRSLADEGRTILISSHILGELAECCDDVTILDRGRVRFSGPMRELLARSEDGRRRHVIELARPDPELVGVPGVLHGVCEARTEGSTVVVELDPARTSIGAVLDVLLSHGAVVESVREDQRGLDEAFLELTSPAEEG